MRIVVVGGGPAGLYFALLMKKLDPGHGVTVLERNPPDATYGWGVVFSEETLGALRDADRPSFDRITEAFATWSAIHIHYRGQLIRSRGHAFSAISRRELLGILQGRCAELGVELRFGVEVGGVEDLPPADVVVGADGVNSVLRRALAEHLRPSLEVHRTKYAWFGTDLVFPAFTFIFRENEHGLFQVHAYPFDAQASTFIVECPEGVWRRAGLDRAGEEESLGYCEALFAEELAGHKLLSNRSVWISFVTLRCEAWHQRNVVLLGDAAHTAHFTIGSGTKLAMEDAVSLAAALDRHGSDLEAAFTDYELERQPVVERFQQAAMESAAYFENVRRYARFEPVQFAFNLLTRSGRITHLELEKRDPELVAEVDAWFASRGRLRRVLAPPPVLAPLALGGRILPNRAVLSPPGEDDAVEGMPSEALVGRLAAAAESGVGLVLTELVAVSAHGRITPGTPGLYEEGHAAAWGRVVEAIHAAGALAGVRLGHAGPRGSTRPRREGLDRPLREGGWPLVAASDVPYAPWTPRPHPLTDRMADVVEDFAAAAGLAARTGFDLLEVDLSHGYLLATFLSPLTNRRTDRYGGPLEARLRYPLEVLEAVREAWPRDRPLAVRLTATDWIPGGLEVEEAVRVAAILRDRGVELVEVVAGQTVAGFHPDYRRLYLVPYADRVRNEAGITTLVGGVATNDEANTVLAAGRADLCLFTLGR